MTRLRSAWDDQDLRERDRRGKSFGKGRTVHFAEADTEWYTEQIAHSISGDAAELEVTWSFDLVEAIWWCGILDPSIPEPDVMDWSDDWSYSESSPCAEDVFNEQSQVLALTSDDVSSPGCPTGGSTGSQGESNFGSGPISGGVSVTKSQWFLFSFQLVFQSKGQRQGQGSHLWPKRSFLETVS